MPPPEQGPGRQFLVLKSWAIGSLRGHAENRGQAVRSGEGVRKQKPPIWGLPGGPAVKNPPSKAGGRGPFLQAGSLDPHAVGQLSLGQKIRFHTDKK